MQTKIHEPTQIVEVMLTHAEQADEAVKKQLRELYAQYKGTKYTVAVFLSGRGGSASSSAKFFAACNDEWTDVQYYLQRCIWMQIYVTMDMAWSVWLWEENKWKISKMTRFSFLKIKKFE